MKTSTRFYDNGNLCAIVYPDLSARAFDEKGREIKIDRVKIGELRHFSFFPAYARPKHFLLEYDIEPSSRNQIAYETIVVPIRY